MSLAGQTSMAIKAGCTWIELDPDGVADNELQDIIDKCRDNGIILVFRHNDVLLEKTRVHGIHLSQGDITPDKLRERLGGHPIIGIDVTPDVSLQPLKRADADYVVLNGYPEMTTIDDVTRLRDNQLSQGITLPIVVSGHMSPNDIQPIIDAGASGFNIDISSLQAPVYEASLSAFKNAADNITAH